jgi:hypothetical protein
VLESGLRALDKALEIRPEYYDAMAYMNLLIRERADLRDTAEEYRRDIAIADEWVQRALATKKAKAGGGGGDRSAPPPLPPPRRIRIAGDVMREKLVRSVATVYPWEGSVSEV